MLEHEDVPPSRFQVIVSVAPKIGCSAQTLNEWIKTSASDDGRRAAGPAAKKMALDREDRELRQCEVDQETLQWTASPTNDSQRRLRPGGARPPVDVMIAFIDDHREQHGVQPIRRVRPIPPSPHCALKALRRDPSRRSDRARRDDESRPRIDRVFDETSRRSVGWRVGKTTHAGFVPDALAQAVHQRSPGASLNHHSDRGSHYLAMKDAERLAEAGIEPSVGRARDSHHNARAEAFNGPFKAEILNRLPRGAGKAE